MRVRPFFFITKQHFVAVMFRAGEKLFKFEEILPMYQVLKDRGEGTFNEFKEAFKTYDREGQGFMSAMELRATLTCMGMDANTGLPVIQIQYNILLIE